MHYSRTSNSKSEDDADADDDDDDEDEEEELEKLNALSNSLRLGNWKVDVLRTEESTKRHII